MEPFHIVQSLLDSKEHWHSHIAGNARRFLPSFGHPEHEQEEHIVGRWKRDGLIRSEDACSKMNSKNLVDSDWNDRNDPCSRCGERRSDKLEDRKPQTGTVGTSDNVESNFGCMLLEGGPKRSVEST